MGKTIFQITFWDHGVHQRLIHTKLLSQLQKSMLDHYSKQSLLKLHKNCIHVACLPYCVADRLPKKPLKKCVCKKMFFKK